MNRSAVGELESLGITGAAVEGGVEFSGRLQAAYLANLCLRTANRILLRVHEFRATNFRALAQEAAAFPWELFIAPGALLRIHVTTHHCRLHHSDAIAERVQNAITERLSAFSVAEARMPLQIFIRGVDDRFTASLDSSGENLYRRGIKPMRARPRCGKRWRRQRSCWPDTRAKRFCSIPCAAPGRSPLKRP
ncbi:MAG: THUMP domain-containing protein [Desulfomicrobium escambiense]|nr:THUMP domain-containing protein [Desulfomicrobium escambiense]